MLIVYFCLALCVLCLTFVAFLSLKPKENKDIDAMALFTVIGVLSGLIGVIAYVCIHAKPPGH